MKNKTRKWTVIIMSIVIILVIIVCVNKILVQSNNIKKVQNINQENRIIPHFVDFKGKLFEVWDVSGYRGFEVDIIFDSKSKTFSIGHNYIGKHTLEDFLEFIDSTKLTKIWLDWKNYTTLNQGMAFERLVYLNKKYNIKKSVILESKLENNIMFGKFTEAGWHTSFYLPTHKILDNKQDIQKLIDKINYSNIKAISFDYRLYPFVKKNLEKRISKEIIYHTWDTRQRLDNKSFLYNIKSKNYFRDPRVKTILVTYCSLLKFIK